MIRHLGEGSDQYLVFVDTQFMVSHESVLQENKSCGHNQGKRNDILETDEYRTKPFTFSAQGIVSFQYKGRRERSHVP